jgi:hypothetical protein
VDPSDLAYEIGDPDEKLKVSMRIDWLEFRKEVKPAKRAASKSK